MVRSRKGGERENGNKCQGGGWKKLWAGTIIQIIWGGKGERCFRRDPRHDIDGIEGFYRMHKYGRKHLLSTYVQVPVLLHVYFLDILIEQNGAVKKERKLFWSKKKETKSLPLSKQFGLTGKTVLFQKGTLK